MEIHAKTKQEKIKKFAMIAFIKKLAMIYNRDYNINTFICVTKYLAIWKESF